jgi:hypothetical protein
MIQGTVRLYSRYTSFVKEMLTWRQAFAVPPHSEEAEMTSAIMAFLHHLAAFTLTAAVIYEHTTFHKNLSLADARRIQRMDIIYGGAAWG